jgi:four helix bundle protein
MDVLIAGQKWEDMAYYIVHDVVKQLPRAERYAMGMQIRSLVLSVGTHISRATMIRDTRYKIREVAEADYALNELKTVIRLADRLRYIDKKKFEISVNYTAELGRILGGWNKSLSTRGQGL